MDTSLFLLWLIAGSGGTRWPTRKSPPRPPISQVLLNVAVGLTGGVLGGWLFTVLLPPAHTSIAVIYAAVSGLFAFAGARLLTDLLGVTALGPQPIPTGLVAMPSLRSVSGRY